tara:strand:- start:4371 stop:4514 length:144 start_codon:yes stop_codon:yes gene_type:complete
MVNSSCEQLGAMPFLCNLWAKYSCSNWPGVGIKNAFLSNLAKSIMVV